MNWRCAGRGCTSRRSPGPLRLSLLLARQATLAKDLETAMISRSTIDQALGVIMGQNRTTRDEAFEILRAASQSRNVKLREVAALIIQNLTGHPPAEPPPFDRGHGKR